KNAGEGVEAEEIAKQSGLAIFRLSRGRDGLAGGMDFHSKPTQKQLQAVRQIKSALGGDKELFSVSAWREKGTSLSADAPIEK
ncbi:hypothetical protein Q0P10_14060, partial [Staphylococcus aureus]|nr:hypothetical protein [Staphylococcus aureus]